MKYLKETLSIIRETYRGWSQANSVMLAAALSFYTLFSLAPLLFIAVSEVMRTGQLRIESGLICYWKLRMTASGYVEGSNEVRNLPIQSFATTDIIPVSLVFTFWRARYIVAARIVNTVHDSVVAEVHKDDVPRYKRLAVQGFLEDTPRYLKEVYGHDMFVPLGVGITVGPHWGEGEEESISAEEGLNG